MEREAVVNAILETEARMRVEQSRQARVIRTLRSELVQVEEELKIAEARVKELEEDHDRR
jgi:hypothetical protein